jgi:glycosyltransferase involved in cell wall biosynthesis
MVTGRDIVVIGIQAWDIEIGSNCKNIAVEFSRHNRVLYVNSPLDRITKHKEKSNPKISKRIRIANGLEPDLIQIQENLWNLYPKATVESINKIGIPWLYDLLNKHNNKAFAKSIRSAINRLGFKNYLIFNDSSMFLGLYMKELLQPDMYIYYMRDFLTKNPYWRRQGVRLEPQLIRKADLVVNNSTLYADYGRQFNPHSYMVGQGCDVSLFNDIDREIIAAADLKDIPRPVIGYVGFLASRRLDPDLLLYMAQNRPDWSIVLVGPEDDGFKASELHGIKNVYFLGSRDSSVLPDYIKGFDVCINPQLINDATRGNYPRKIDEYLAMGKPTLATATEAMDYFREYTYLGKTGEDYIRLTEQALREDSPVLQQKRRAFATSHTWENNVSEIYRYIALVKPTIKT